MLGLGELEVRGDEAEHEPLHEFGSRTEEGDGPVGGPLLFRLPRFQKRHYNSVLPNVWDAGLSKKQVEESAQV